MKINTALIDRPEEFLRAFNTGIERLERHPCSVCRVKPPIPRDHFHGSDWGKCRSMILYERLTGIKEQMTPQKQSFLRDGHLHEASIVSALRAAGVTLTDTAETNPEEIHHTGVDTPAGRVIFSTIIHTDGVIVGHNKRILCECKSVKDYAWKTKFCKGIIPETYYGQCQAYMHFKGLDGALLFVKNRHTSELMIPFYIHPDPEYIEGKTVELAAVTHAISNRIIFPRPVEKKTRRDSECLYCMFKQQCWL